MEWSMLEFTPLQSTIMVIKPVTRKYDITVIVFAMFPYERSHVIGQ